MAVDATTLYIVLLGCKMGLEEVRRTAVNMAPSAHKLRPAATVQEPSAVHLL